MRVGTSTTAATGILCAALVACALIAGCATAVSEAAAVRRQRERALIQTLTGDAAWAEKDKACREAQEIGTRACIPALARLLADPQLSHPARCALEPMPYPEAGAALRRALPRTEGQVKVGIIHSLGIRREQAAVPDLLPLLKAEDVAIAAAAATALGRAGSLATAPALAEFRAAAPIALRPVAAEASLVLAERLLAQGERAAAAQIYADLQAESWPQHVRLGAFAGALLARPEDAVNALIGAITGDDPVRRGVAIACVPSLPGAAIASGIASELPRLPPDTQVLLIGVLAARGPVVREAILGVGKAATSTAVRGAVAKALGRIGDAGCAGWLVEVIATDDAAAADAAQALVVLPGETVSAALRQQLVSAAAKVRPQLIDVLLRRQDLGAVDVLLDQASAADAAVRRAAFRALGGLASPERIPALLERLLATPDDASRTEAERALAAVARRAENGPARSAAVLAALATHAEPEIRCSLLRVLGGIAGPEALAAVRDRALSSTAAAGERTVAVKALAVWPDSAALEPLAEMLGPDLSPVQRTLALRGLVRLLSTATDRSPEARVQAFRRAAQAADNAEARKLLLGGLTTVTHPDALALAVNWLDDEAVRAEAALAAVSLAEAVLGCDREAAVAAARRLADGAGDEAVKERARQILQRVERFEDYIVGWLIAGPYSAAGKAATELFDLPFAPEEGDASQAAWRLLPPTGRPDLPWMLTLTDEFGGERRAGYLRTWVQSPRAMPVRLEAGVDDGIKVWLNGKVVHANNSSGAAVPGEEKADVALIEGWNLLMVKVLQDAGPCEFCVRFRTPEGGPVAGLLVAPLQQIPGGALAVKAVAPPPPVAAPVSPPTGEVGWIRLFNGTDLSGWQQTGQGVFKVEDGCLIGTQTDGQGGDLLHEAEWKDFELRATYRVTWPANSGIWFRYDGKNGYQFDILKWSNPVAYSGTLYCPAKMFITANLNEGLERRDDWNEAAVRAAGEELTLWLNGTQVGACRDSAISRGRIGIQVHAGDEFKGMRIALRRIEVRPLPPVEAPSAPGGGGAQLPAADSSPVRFAMHRVGTFRSEACGVGDVNGDGRLDVVAGPFWYEAPTWTAHAFRTLDGQVGEDGKGYYDDFMNAPLDVDGDGRLDLVTCCWFAKALRWYRQTPAADGQWPLAVADTNGNFETGELADVDGDGKLREIVPAVAHTCWYDLAPGADGKQGLRRHDIDPKERPWGSGVGDVNGDGRPDILRPDAWFEAPVDPRQGAWTEHAWALGAKDGGVDHVSTILVYDVDADGRNDVITSSAHTYGIWWYRQVREGDRLRWEQHLIDDSWSQAHSLALADLDGDGDLDLVAGKRFMAHNGSDPDENAPLGVYWYELQRASQPLWIRHAITYGEGVGAGLNVCVADLDGDTDPDIVVTGKWGGPVWFENLGR
jgi:HEAT repeat protein